MQLVDQGAGRRHVLATLAAFACALPCGLACDGGAPARTPVEQAVSGVSTRKGDVPIEFEAKKAGTKAFPFPFVEGTVAGQKTRFLLDTGAAVHAIDASLAAAAQLGSPAKATSITIDGWGALPEHAVVVRELPALLRTHGIGGVIAPQLLAESPDQAVVVDLVNRQLRIRPKSTSSSELADLGTNLSGASRKPCPADSDGIAGRALAVDATVDGEPTHLAIDTGASRTMLLEGSKAGARAAGRPVLGRSVVAGAASDVATSIYGAVPFTVGAWSSPLDVGVGAGHRPPQCGAEGRLGMDVLQQCAIAMTSDELLVACRAPAPVGH
jgi:hypothetical protein